MKDNIAGFDLHILPGFAGISEKRIDESWRPDGVSFSGRSYCAVLVLICQLDMSVAMKMAMEDYDWTYMRKRVAGDYEYLEFKKGLSWKEVQRIDRGETR